VVDAMAAALLTVDARGVVTRANAAAREALGRDLADLIGSDLHATICPLPLGGGSHPRHQCPTLAPLHSGGPSTGEERFRRADGTVLTVEMTASPIHDGDRLTGAVVSFRSGGDRRASHYEQEVHRLAAREQAQQEFLHQLQEAVTPRQPVVEGVELGVHYLAADPSAPSGGDLYDWQVLPDGDLHLMVVDVIGSGVSATRDALAVVHAVRVLVLEGCPIGQVVSRTDELLTDGQPSLVATILVARYTPATGRMVVAGGGHPPMLVVSPTGVVREVVAPGIPIGWPEAGSFDVAEVTLDRSDTALFYTDGLIEARRDILAGLSDLKAAAAETATYPPHHLPRVLVERALAGAQRRDDTLALALRRRSPPSGPGIRLLGPFEYRFTPRLVAVPVARHLFLEWAYHQALGAADVDDLVLVVSELCTNAVRMASGEERGVTLRAWPEGPDLVIEVQDDGPGFEGDVPSGEDLPPLEQVSGRGLFLVQSLADSVSVVSTPGGTVVRCVKRHLFAESSAPAAR
jgi:PAS domain S-box-containing protein